MSFVKTLLFRCPSVCAFKSISSIRTYCRHVQIVNNQTGHILPSSHTGFVTGASCWRVHLSTMANSTDTSSILVVDHDTKDKMFFINLDGEPERAVLEYEIIGPDAVDLYHTGVPVSQRGKGIAKILAKAALDHFASQGTSMKLTCTYLQKYIVDNPTAKYKDWIL